MPLKKKKEYNAYMRDFMKIYRAKERKMIHEYRQIKGIPNGRRKKKK